MGKKILGIVGSYRRNGTIDTIVSEVLSSAASEGAEIEKLYVGLRENIHLSSAAS